MKRTAQWLTGVLLLSPLLAQEPAGPSQTAAARLKELQTEQRQLVQEWQKQMKAASVAAEQAKADGKPIPALPMRPDFSSVRVKYLAAAKEYKGEDAVSFLMPVLNMSSKPEQTKEVLDILLADHIKSPQLTQLGGMLGYLDRMVDADYAKQVREKIAKESDNPDLLGWLAFAKHEAVLQGESPTSKAFLDAKVKLMEAIAKASDARLKQQAQSLIDVAEKFGNGMVAPDIAGKDLDDVEFKLSDYKGKIVFLDFWGDW